MTPVRAPVIRPFLDGDIPFALAQMEREGWSSSAEVMRVHLQHDPHGCFIAEIHGEAAGMITTTALAAGAWIGNLIVPPTARGEGVGTLLMEHGIGHLAARGYSTVRLEADPMGVNIYRRLGFVDEFESPRFALAGPMTAGRSTAVPLASGDLAAVAAFDTPRYGDDRGRLLRGLYALSSHGVRLPARGRLAGYLMLQPCVGGTRLGPWVAESVEAAADLLRHAAPHLGRFPTVVALPGSNRAGQELLASCGFHPTPSSLRMVRGPQVAAGRPECVFGLASGAVG